MFISISSLENAIEGSWLVQNTLWFMEEKITGYYCVRKFAGIAVQHVNENVVTCDTSHKTPSEVKGNVLNILLKWNLSEAGIFIISRDYFLHPSCILSKLFGVFTVKIFLICG